MPAVVTDFDRPDEELVDRFEPLPVAVLADVTGSPTAMDHGITPVAPAPAMVGTAVTVRTPARDNLMVHKAVTLAEPGDVIVVDTGGFTEGAVWGDLLSTSATVQGLSGTVVDGAVRDRADIADLGYPVFSRALSPKNCDKVAGGEINVPIDCGGRVVNPGDIIVGDGDGVAVVDPAAAPAIADRARAKLDREEEIREAVSEGAYIYDLLDLEATYGELDLEEN